MNNVNGNTPGRFEIVSLARDDGVSTVVLAGDLDLVAAPTARKLLMKECASGPKQLVVDISRLDFVDSAGLGMLVAAKRALGANGGTFALIGASERVLRLLQLTGLSQLLGVPGAA